MTDEAAGTARPASVEDLKLLLGALDAHDVDYLLIGGYALYALGYERGTVDIDIVVRPTVEQGEKVRRNLSILAAVGGNHRFRGRTCADLEPGGLAQDQADLTRQGQA